MCVWLQEMMFCLSTVHSNYVQVLGMFVVFEAQFYFLPPSVWLQAAPGKGEREREGGARSKLSVAAEAAAG